MTSPSNATLPLVIQGGMGIGVSSWSLARAVASRGQLGVVSGTCIDSLFVRRLQDGDAGGHLRRAMEAFPIPDAVTHVMETYFLPEGRDEGEPYKLLPMWKQNVSRSRELVTMLSSFAEVYLAREGHDGDVGINLLTKVQLPNLATLYGAMLAGVDYVLMGAGIPREIPGALDAFARHEPATLRFEVEGLSRGRSEELSFVPADHWEAGTPPEIDRPRFLPIVSTHSLARILTRKANGRIDGFVVEAPTAGGHNAPPRGKLSTNERGEPVYGGRDEVDFSEMQALELPFWLAGGAGSPEGLKHALENGAAGIQVGTLFAYARESGLDPELRQRTLAGVKAGEVEIYTDLRASPTGFPFKVVEMEGTNSQTDLYEERGRICDLGYLRTAYERDDGRIGYRCPAEPVKLYAKKGGAIEATRGRKCLCNALMADVGHGQLREEGPERPILTSGDDLMAVERFLQGRESYGAEDVLDYLLSGIESGWEDQVGSPHPAAANVT